MADHGEHPHLEALLDFLRGSRGFDFSGYKRASLVRRIDKRMGEIGIADYAQYVDYLEVHPEEYDPLFNTILINVTSFFRDTPTWDAIAADVIPRIIGRLGIAEPIRIWSAGCASGEEPYSLAMLFAEALGPDKFRDRVKIYATDIDEEALAKARQAQYTDREIEGVTDALREKYFDRVESGWAVKKELRRSVIFGRHDLIQDAPISRVDLITCRNALMYFNAETQARVLARFHFALSEGGFLVLGRAETLLTHSGAFQPFDLKRRISVKTSRPNVREQLLLMASATDDGADGNFDGSVRAREAAFDVAPVAQVVVDVGGRLMLANERARILFGVTASDLGRPLQDLRLSYRPVELRSMIEQSYADRRAVQLKDVEWQVGSAGEQRWFDIQLTPLIDGAGERLGAAISFTDGSVAKRLQRELEKINVELQTAYEELQSTNEELETTNEELQSTVEELETTNEELQSTNEELETMNQELQSTNEELQTMNDELRTRGDEVTQINFFLESILSSLRGGVAVIDNEMRVMIWNARAEDLWGVRASEVEGRHLLNLDIGLPLEALRQSIRETLAGDGITGELHLSATNRRGRPIQCRVMISRLASPAGETRGAIVVMDADDGAPNEKADGAGATARVS